MINFRLFGIPVVVEPWFWLTTFLLGNGLNSFNDRQGLIDVGLWMLVCFVSILVHEFGHAMVGRRLAGGRPFVRLWAMGGLAYNNDGRFTKKTRLTMILAGPGAGIALFGITVGAIFLMFPGATGLQILDFYIRGGSAAPVNPEAYNFLTGGSPTARIFDNLIWINLWWSLVNLLPVHPLDGGQAITSFIRSPKKVHQIGFITGLSFAVIGFTVLGSFYIALMFGFLAYQNFQAMQNEAY